jgi:hypothetical protein
MLIVRITVTAEWNIYENRKKKNIEYRFLSNNLSDSHYSFKWTD